MKGSALVRIGWAVLIWGVSAQAIDFSGLNKNSQERYCAFVVAGVLPGQPLAPVNYNATARLNSVREAGIAAQRAAEMESAYALSQLALPNELRDQKDPRWFFVGLRGGDATNPVRQELEIRKEIGPAVASHVKRMNEALDELVALNRIIEKRPENSDLEIALNRLLAGKLAEVEKALTQLEQLLPEATNSGEARTFVAAATDSLQKSARELREAIQSSDRTELWEQIEKSRLEQAKELAHEITNRKLGKETVKELLSLAVRNQVELELVLTYFKALDEAGYSRDKDGVQDRFLLILTEMGLRRKVAPEKLMAAFLELDKAGAGKEFLIYDREVAVLLDIALEYQLAPEAVAKKFLEIYERGKKQRDDFYIIDQAAVILTAESYAHKLTSKQIVDKFFNVYDEFKKPNRLGDIAVAILVGLELQKPRGEGELHQRYVALKDEAIRLGVKLPTEALARVLVVALQYELDGSKAASLLRRADQAAGRSSFERDLAVMTIALASNPDGNISDEQMAEAARLSFLTLNSPSDYLKEKSTHPSSSSAQASRSGYSASNEARSSDDDSSSGFGLGITLDSDGLHPTANFGGFGIDLTDGSPTINLGGGFSIDTDGDGFGVKLF